MPEFLDINQDKVHVDGTDDKDQYPACNPPASVKESSVTGGTIQPIHKQKRTLSGGVDRTGVRGISK